MKNFRTFDLAVKFYQETQKLTLTNNFKDQLDRAASSIALNLAEGSGRNTLKDQRRFFSIAMGSLRECQAILTLSGLENAEIAQTADILGAHLFKLIRNVIEAK